MVLVMFGSFVVGRKQKHLLRTEPRPSDKSLRGSAAVARRQCPRLRSGRRSDPCQDSLTFQVNRVVRGDTGGMPRAALSMRWWLGLVFATIAALTALSVAEVFNHRADMALRDRGQALAVGQSVAAAQSITLAAPARRHRRPWRRVVAERHRLSVFVFSRSGTLVYAPRSRGIRVPGGAIRRRAQCARR